MSQYIYQPDGSGPYNENSTFVKKITGCGNPELLDLTQYSFVVYVPPTPTPPTLAEAKTAAIATIKQIRSSTLDKFAKNSPGVPIIYRSNLIASVRYQAADTTIIPETGQTPEQYLSVLGSKFGFPTAAAFASYIIAENLRLGAPNTAIPSAYDVECKYGESITAVNAALTVAVVQTLVDVYTAYCQPVTGQ